MFLCLIWKSMRAWERCKNKKCTHTKNVTLFVRKHFPFHLNTQQNRNYSLCAAQYNFQVYPLCTVGIFILFTAFFINQFIEELFAIASGFYVALQISAYRNFCDCHIKYWRFYFSLAALKFVTRFFFLYPILHSNFDYLSKHMRFAAWCFISIQIKLINEKLN